jgi:hypothetical protein
MDPNTDMTQLKIFLDLFLGGLLAEEIFLRLDISGVLLKMLLLLY